MSKVNELIEFKRLWIQGQIQLDMEKKRNKVLFWVFATLMGLSMISAAGLYFFNYEHAYQEFTGLGFPTWLIYPLGIAKIAGTIGVLQERSIVLRVWAYAGLTFNTLLAFGAHWFVNDGEWFGPIIVLIFIAGTHYFQQKRAKDLTTK